MTQKTIQREVGCSGIGLHTGRQVQMRLRPAPPDFGIRFCRVDSPGRPMIPARFERVVQTDFATTLGLNGITISTTEHLLAAFVGAGIDNALVELDAPEVPIFDGSAAPYLSLLKGAGIEEQHSPRQVLRVLRPLEVRDGEAYVRAWPADQLQVTYTIDYPHPLLGRQTSRWDFTTTSFALEIAGARTFGFLKDLNQLQAMGLARGGSLANAIVFDDNQLLNRDGFRFGDECVRHKILDFIGDLALVGRPVLAHFEAYKAGHTLHNRLIRELVEPCGRSQVLSVSPVHHAIFRIPQAATTLQAIPMGF